MFYRPSAFAIALSLSIGTASHLGAESVPDELNLSTEKVIVFKDGYALVLKKATGKTNDRGEVFTEEVPDAAILGSFWTISREGRLISMKSGWETVKTEEEKEVPCLQHIEILRANEGKECTATLNSDTTLKGKIKKALAQESSSALSSTVRSSLGFSALAPSANPPTSTITAISGNSFILSTADGDVLLPVSQIRTLTVPDMRTTIARKVTKTKRSKRLTIRLADANKEHELTIRYFRPGLRWIPAYRINLAEDAKVKKAKISLQAEILNEAEDLEDVPIDIVVGVPHFRFKETPSPLVLERTLHHALRQAAPQLMQTQVRNDFTNNGYMMRSSEFRRDAARSPAQGTMQLPNELTATGAQDLFVYHLAKIDLKKGERTAVHIFEDEVEYRDIYTWNLHVKKRDYGVSRNSQSPLNISKNEIWHQIELTNSTKLPWTTGAAMVMQGIQPLAQDMLTYTSPSDVVRVPLTISVSTKGTFDEEEVSRQLSALKWNGSHYAKIGREATIGLCNHKAIPIDIEVTFRVGGKAEEVSDKGDITLGAYNAQDWQNYRGHPAVNYSSTVKWKFNLKPGDVVSPKVGYHYFTRH